LGVNRDFPLNRSELRIQKALVSGFWSCDVLGRARSSGSVITVGRGVRFRLMSSQSEHQQSFSLCARLTARYAYLTTVVAVVVLHARVLGVSRRGGRVGASRRRDASRRGDSDSSGPVEHLKRGCGLATRTLHSGTLGY